MVKQKECSKCKRKGVEGDSGWLYMDWITDAKGWQGNDLCPDCASKFELWLMEG